MELKFDHKFVLFHFQKILKMEQLGNFREEIQY